MAAITELYAAHGFWIWLAVGAAILAVEVSTGSGWLLWPSASAAATALVTLVTNSLAAEIGVFAGLTIVSSLLARRFWPRRTDDAGDINDNVSRLLGHAGRATSAFASGDGRVMVDGKEWAAELDGGGALAAGAEVEVTGLSGGSRLRVRARS